MKKYKNIILTTSILSVVLVAVLLITSKVYAGFGSFGGSYFGGQVMSKIMCSCNVDGGYQLTISGPFGSSGTYLENSMTRIYGNGEISMMSRLLGKATQGGVCLIGAQPYCTELPITEGTIDYTGLASGF